MSSLLCASESMGDGVDYNIMTICSRCVSPVMWVFISPVRGFFGGYKNRHDLLVVAVMRVIHAYMTDPSSSSCSSPWAVKIINPLSCGIIDIGLTRGAARSSGALAAQSVPNLGCA